MTNKNNPADPKPANPKPTSPRKLASAPDNGATSKHPQTSAASLQITHGMLAKTIAIWRQLRVWSFQSLDMAREIARQDPADAFRALCLDEAKTRSNSPPPMDLSPAAPRKHRTPNKPLFTAGS